MTLMDFSSLQKFPTAVSRPLLSLRKTTTPDEPSAPRTEEDISTGTNQANRDHAGLDTPPFVFLGGAAMGTKNRRESTAAGNILSTWGLTNAVMTGEQQSGISDNYVCPNDRQLSLRAKLGTGWSMRTHKRSQSVQKFTLGRRLSARYKTGSVSGRKSPHSAMSRSSPTDHNTLASPEEQLALDLSSGGVGGASSGTAAGGAYESTISENEMAVIQAVIKRAEQITTMEQQRIGKMISQLKEIKDQSTCSPTGFPECPKSFTFSLPAHQQSIPASSFTNNNNNNSSSPLDIKLSPASNSSDFACYDDVIDSALCHTQSSVTTSVSLNECNLCGSEFESSAAELMSNSLNTITSAIFSELTSGGPKQSASSVFTTGGTLCNDCKNRVCSRCVVKVFIPKAGTNGEAHALPSHHRHLSGPLSKVGTAVSSAVSGHASTIAVCKLCAHQRETWKKSGAWFYHEIPAYILPPMSLKERRKSETTYKQLSASNQSMASGRKKVSASSDMLRLSNESLCSNSSRTKDTSRGRDVMERLLHTDTNSDTSDVEDLPSKGKMINSLLRSPARKSLNEITHPEMFNCQMLITNQTDKASLAPVPATSRVLSDTSHIVQQRMAAGNCSPSHHSASSSVSSLNSPSALPGGEPSSPMTSTSPGGQMLAVTEESSKYEDRGMLEFSVTYDADAYTLQIALHRAIDLPPMDVNGLADPYVKLHLLPDSSKATKKRSHTKSKTLNPVWNEFFAYYGVSPEETQTKVLRLSVFDEDCFGQNEFIGEVRLELSQLKSRVTQRLEVPLQKQVTGNTNVTKLDLEDELATGDGVGKILIGVMYMFKAQCLVVTIKRCAQLKSMDNNGYSDPYVKVYLRPDQCKESKRKTSIVKKCLNPDFNEEFTYPNVKISELANKTLEVTVWDNDFGLKNDYIGGLTLSMGSKGEKLRHWLKIFKRPDVYFEQWHLLSKEPPNIVPINMESMFQKKLSMAAQSSSSGPSNNSQGSPVTPGSSRDATSPNPNGAHGSNMGQGPGSSPFFGPRSNNVSGLTYPRSPGGHSNHSNHFNQSASGYANRNR